MKSGHSTHEQDVVGAKTELSSLKAAYMHHLRSYLALPVGTGYDRTGAILGCQQSGNAFFNYAEEFVGNSDLLGAHGSALWAQGFAEDCAEILKSIPDHIQFLRTSFKKEGIELAESTVSPGNTAYANMQRMVVKYLTSQEAHAIRDQFVKAQLPVYGFDNPAKHVFGPEQRATPKSPTRPLYKVVFGILAFVFILIGARWFIRREACPPLAIPHSHFVKSEGNKKVIIFVHGVLGDVDNTWSDPKTHTSWPALISSDPAMADFDIYIYGYKSSCGGDASNITEIANRMGRQLEDDHFFSRYREIDFITHSMGGLVTKKMLSALNTPDDSDKLQLVHTVLFIAVPAAGAPVASLAEWLSDNPQFKNMSPEDSKAYLQSIDDDWANMSRARTTDRPFPHYFVAYETGELATLKIVPALYSSTSSDLSPIAFDYNHISIVKPTSINDEVYQWARARIIGPTPQNQHGIIQAWPAKEARLPQRK